jgi:regulator of protease activity HflC (stomatin/prohibitin superfamily)
MNASSERPTSSFSGWFMLFFVLIALPVTLIWIPYQMSQKHILPGLLGVPVLLLLVICLKGFFTLQPNEAGALLLLGSYRGTVRDSGFRWANPFYSVRKVSLRSYNLNSERLKVNDKGGNPIEIGAVVVWRIRDTAQALFDVDDCGRYVSIQSESALRHLASSFHYDNAEHGETTLRSGGDEVSEALQTELEARLAKAGVQVEEARIAHLAYAPEIAQAMLRRQQAEAVVAARTKIVQGAVGMVQLALDELAKNNVVRLDDERKAAMVSNLLVVLCGEAEAQPVINTGTLYT